MYEDALQKAGLDNKEATVYEALLRLGKAGMGRLVRELPYKRANTYNIVADLIAKGLVAEVEERGKKIFLAENPGRLEELLDQKREELTTARGSLQVVLPALKSAYALALGKPGVRMYEGLEGIKQVLDDTLINNPEKKIDTFSDVAGYARYLKDWNTRSYAPKRKRLGIVEHVVVPDTPEARTFLHGYVASSLTEIAFIDAKTFPFATEINMYSNKVSFVTFSEKTHIGVLLDNQEIFQTLQSVFNLVWKAHRMPETIKSVVNNTPVAPAEADG